MKTILTLTAAVALTLSAAPAADAHGRGHHHGKHDRTLTFCPRVAYPGPVTCITR